MIRVVEQKQSGVLECWTFDSRVKTPDSRLSPCLGLVFSN
jgi:hypothetical protein